MTKKTDPSPGLDLTGQIVGYARVSSPEQNLDRQTSRLREAGAQKMFTDTVSGSTRDRPSLGAALEYLRAGDTLMVVSMDRLARSLRDLHALIDELTEAGASVQFLQEGQTYSSDPSPSSQLLLSMLGAVAEFERSIIRERQADGIARAKKRGAYKGRSPIPEEKLQKAFSLIKQGVPKAKVARDLKISRSALYDHLKKINSESIDIFSQCRYNRFCYCGCPGFESWQCPPFHNEHACSVCHCSTCRTRPTNKGGRNDYVNNLYSDRSTIYKHHRKAIW